MAKMRRAKKVELVEELKQKLADSPSVIFLDYRGLKVKEASKIRFKLQDSGFDYRVAKNTLLKRATDALQIEGIEPYLEGPTAVVFGGDDPVALAKTLSGLAKEYKVLQFKGGILEKQVIGAETVKKLSELPPKEELIGRAVGGIKAPLYGLVNVLAGNLRNLVYVLNQISEQKAS